MLGNDSANSASLTPRFSGINEKGNAAVTQTTFFRPGMPPSMRARLRSASSTCVAGIEPSASVTASASRSAGAGRILFDGGDITTLPAHRRTRLGIVRSFQIPKPFTSMTVLENLGIPLEYAGRGRAHDGVPTDTAKILKAIGLERKAHLRPAGLTQIEMRKLELARAMAARPKLLISDEAMAGLSSAEVDDILAILFGLSAQGITIIMIEHIMRAVMRFSERIVVLDAGERIAEGTPEEIVKNPAVEKAYLGE